MKVQMKFIDHRDLNQSDSTFSSGFYQCIGSNSAGEDIQTAQLIYAGNCSSEKKNIYTFAVYFCSR